MKIRSIASALLLVLVALVLSSCTQQNTEVKVGSSPSTSADTDVKTNSPPTNLATSELFLFTRNGKYGYIDRTGKIVIPAKLDTPYNESSNSATPAPDELISFAQEDYFGNKTKDFAYRLRIPGVHHADKSISFNKHFYGYKDRRTGKVIIRPQFSNAAARFSEGLAWVMDGGDRVGYIDKQGKIVIPLQYSYSRSRKILGVGYEHSGSDFNGGLAKVCSGGCGYIDRTGKVVIPLKFDKSYVEKTGTVISPLESSSNAGDFYDGLARVCNGKCGYMDRTGKVVIPLKFDEAPEKFSNGLAAVKIKDRLGYIDKTGKIVIPLSYSSAGDFYDGLARVCNDKCGYIDRTGKVVIPLKFDEDEVAAKFSNGLAWVKIKDRLGYIDKTGKVKIPAKFVPWNTDYMNTKYIDSDDADFDRGLAVVKVPKTCESTESSDRTTCYGYGYGYIDTTGKLVFDFFRFGDLVVR
jgi:hypothetical protein